MGRFGSFDASDGTAKPICIHTSPKNSWFYELNRAVVLAFRSIGRGYSAAQKFCSIVNLMVLLAQMKQLFSKTQQRFSVFGTCFDVSNIISHYEYIVKIYKSGWYI